MKILYLLTQSMESPSGLGRYGPLARQLTRLGYQVMILALHPDFANLDERTQEIEGLQIRYVSQMHVRKEGSTKSYFSTPTLLFHAAIATWRMSLAAARLGADIIHICKPHPMNGIAGWIAHKLNRSQLWVDCDDYEAASGRFSQRFQQKVIAWFEKTLPRKADHITTNTHFMQQKLASWGIAPEKITYLPNGVDPGRFDAPTSADLKTLRSELSLQDCQVVLYVGSLSLPSHPISLLIEAFHLILNKCPQARLVIVGGGEDYATLQKMVDEQELSQYARFCGRVPADRVVGYYHLADVCVEPVHEDDAARGRCPIKLFEAWACGTPFVSADIGDRRLLLGDPPAGILARPGDAVSLANSIIEVLANPELGERMAQLGRRRVQDFTWERLALILHAAYQAERRDNLSKPRDL